MNDERYPVAGGSHVLHIHGNDEAGWEVWLNTERQDFDGLVVGCDGLSRILAMVEAVFVLDAARARLVDRLLIETVGAAPELGSTGRSHPAPENGAAGQRGEQGAAHSEVPRCVVCQVAPVSPDHGLDTCPSCAARTAAGIVFD